MPDDEKDKMERVYMMSTIQVKRFVRDCKKRVDEDFGAKLGEKHNENKQLLWKPVKQERVGERTGIGKVKGSDEIHVTGIEAVRDRWRRCSEHTFL